MQLISCVLWGWEFLSDGCYKEVYHKKGVPYVIKFLSLSGYGYGQTFSTYKGRPLQEEFGDQVCGLPSDYIGQTHDNIPFGFQKKVRVFRFKAGENCKQWKHLRERFINAGSVDCHAANIGLDEMSRWVKFD